MKPGPCRIEIRRKDVYAVVSVTAAVGRVDGREPFLVGRIPRGRNDFLFFSIDLVDEVPRLTFIIANVDKEKAVLGEIVVEQVCFTARVRPGLACRFALLILV